MRTIVMLILCMFCLSQIVYAEEELEKVETEEEIEVMAEKPVELPRASKLDVSEYDIPEGVIARFTERQRAVIQADVQMQQKQAEVELASTRLAIMKLEKQRLSEAFSAEFRLFLTAKGVPYDDLPKWQIQNNRAVRTEKGK